MKTEMVHWNPDLFSVTPEAAASEIRGKLCDYSVLESMRRKTFPRGPGDHLAVCGKLLKAWVEGFRTVEEEEWVTINIDESFKELCCKRGQPMEEKRNQEFRF